ncbi:MAG TPA: orotidine-5'-phosphate decarboxylase [candidate division Zixibacteria bacterium]|nr:orotidine-5'-phosphate decarboxylase [candidate division Zixibacteria bacterium]
MAAVEKLRNKQEKSRSLICLGLDLDPKRMPAEYAKSIKGMYEFAMRMVDATSDVVCAYKPNMAFFENRGPEGLSLLRSIIERMPEDMPIILDGKRGDIGNTASFYAEALYEKLKADWVTLNPYMGYDSMRPFLEYKEKGVFVLCLTSNPGSKDFQHLMIDGKPLYKIVAEKVDYWNKDGNCGLVVGATQPEELKEIREVAGAMPILIPGVGAQGGSLEKAVLFGTDNFQKIALINVSRSVLYASKEMDFAQRARQELRKLNEIINRVRNGEIQIDTDTPESVNHEERSNNELPESHQEESPGQEKSSFRLPPIPDLPFTKKPETHAEEPVTPSNSEPDTGQQTEEASETVGTRTEVEPPAPSTSVPESAPHESGREEERPNSQPQTNDRSVDSAPPRQPDANGTNQQSGQSAPPSSPDSQPSQNAAPPNQNDRRQDRPQGHHDRNGQRRFDRRNRRDRRHRNDRNHHNRDNRQSGQDQPKPWERSS